MAIWITALKIIPWGSVLESAPHIVKAAKHVFSAAKSDSSSFAEASSSPVGDGLVNPDKLDKRVRLLEAKIIELSNEQRDVR